MRYLGRSASMSRQSQRIRLRKQARQEQEDDSHHAGMNEGVDACDSEDRTPYTRRSKRIRSRRITLQGEDSEEDDLHPSDHTVMNVEVDARASEGASASEANAVEDIICPESSTSLRRTPPQMSLQLTQTTKMSLVLTTYYGVSLNVQYHITPHSHDHSQQS